MASFALFKKEKRKKKLVYLLVFRRTARMSWKQLMHMFLKYTGCLMWSNAQQDANLKLSLNLL